MWIQLLIIFSSFFFYSCCRDPIAKAQGSFTKRYAKEMNQVNNWYLFGFGGGFHDGFDNLSFVFISQDKLDLNEARNLIVENLEPLHQLINSDLELLPYLAEVPFKRENIELGILFLNSTWDYPKAPFIADVIYMNGKIIYAVFNEEKKILDILHRETYEESFKIVYGHLDECK